MIHRGGHREYEEITPPHVDDFCYITDNTYTKDEVFFTSHPLTFSSGIWPYDLLKLEEFAGDCDEERHT